MITTWLPALAGMCCLALGPGLMAIYGFFVAPLSKEFSVGAAVLNMGPVALLLVPAFLGAAVGKLADRMPVRQLLLIGANISMLSLLAVSVAPALWQAALGFLSFAVGLMFYGPIVVNGMLVKQFHGREARALAIAAIGISIASAAMPPLVGTLLHHLDWRAVLQVMALGMLACLWLVILTGVPRGSVAQVAGAKAPASGGFYRSKAFWLIGLGVALSMNMMIVLAVAYPPLLAGRGYSVVETGWFLSLVGVCGLLGKSIVAWLGDRARQQVKWLAVAMLLAQAAGLCLVYLAGDAWLVALALAVLGTANGAFVPMHPYLNSRYFDAAINSEVTGAQMPLFLPFGLIGAPLAGYAYDRSGSYEPVLLALVAVLAVAILLVSRLPAPIR